MVIVAFPVYWMLVTSFRPNSQIRSAPRFLPVGTLDNYRSVFERDHFWSSFANSLQVTLLTVVFALFTAFLAAVAVSRFRFRGRLAFLVVVLLVQMVPAEALMISVVKVLEGWDLRNSIAGPDHHLRGVRAAVHGVDAAGLRGGVPASWRRRPWWTAPAGCGRSSR